MADSNLIVDDGYCERMGTFFMNQGTVLDGCIAEYLAVMEGVRQTAIVSGETERALSAYITQAQKMNQQIVTISQLAKGYAQSFASEVDVLDRFFVFT